MNDQSNRRRQFFANKFHRQVFLLFLLAALLPTALAVIALYYLIFGIAAIEAGMPETIAYTLIPAAKKVAIVLLSATPVIFIALLILAHKLTHTAIGPYDRIVDELDECLEGKRRGPLLVRKTDKFLPLVERINKLLNKLNK